MQGFRAVLLALDVQLAATASRAPLRARHTRSATPTLDTAALTRDSAATKRTGASSSLDQAAEILDRSGADDTPGDLAVRGDHERAGEGADGNELVEFRRDKVAWVLQAWVGNPVVLHVGLRAGRVVLHVDTDELDARWLSCCAATASAGASCWQTVHHDPRKFSTTTWPRSAARRSSWPVSVGPDTAGIRGCCPGDGS
jgi:hypothetical protein